MYRVLIFLYVGLQYIVSAFNPSYFSKKVFTKQAFRSQAIIPVPSREIKNTSLKALENLGTVEGIAEAFVGGTVGVMSVMFLLEIKKKDDLRLEACPYCMGNGEILCGTCLGE